MDDQGPHDDSVVIHRGPILEIVARADADRVVLRLAGELDLSESDSLEAAIERTQDGTSCTVIDVTGLDYIDSSGIRALLKGAASLEANGRTLMVLVAPGLVARTLDLVRLGDRIAIVTELPSAG